MRQKISYLITLLIGLLVGALVIIGVVKYFPNSSVVKTIQEKNVTITDTGISEAVHKIEGSVVVIQTYSKGELIGTGTGFVYDTDDDNGYIMTNHHVIESGETIKITYNDDSETTAK